MERLFSPWRSEYISTFKNPEKNSICIFCDALKSKNNKKKLVLFRSKHCFVMMNLYPYNNGHLMVVPNKHTSELKNLSKNVNSDILKTISIMMMALDNSMKPQGYNVGANFGRVAGAGIDSHIHFHIVPRWSGDTNFMPVLNDVKLVSEGIKKTYSKISKSLSKIKK